MQNGKIPQSKLAKIPGNGQLYKPAAYAYRAMAARAKKDGVDLSIWEGPIRRTYRPLASQWMAWNLYKSGQGNLAATPGSSNHGLGIAVDLMNQEQRNWIDKHGAYYGFSKKWSDAAGEWWHIRWKAGVWKPKPTVPIIKKGSHGVAVQKLQVYLRRAGYLPATWHVHQSYTLTVRRAVRKFQKDHKLPVDGVVGPTTWRKLRSK